MESVDCADLRAERDARASALDDEESQRHCCKMERDRAWGRSACQEPVSQLLDVAPRFEQEIVAFLLVRGGWQANVDDEDGHSEPCVFGRICTAHALWPVFTTASSLRALRLQCNEERLADGVHVVIARLAYLRMLIICQGLRNKLPLRL